MRLALNIDMPESLPQAIQWYHEEMERRGYEVIGSVEAHWQSHMFRDDNHNDAYVIADVRRH